MCHFVSTIYIVKIAVGRSQWPRGVRRRSAAAQLLRSWVRFPPMAWIFVCCERRVLSGRRLCDELITRPEESYRLCCVVVCDLETSRIGAPYIYDISRLRVKLKSENANRDGIHIFPKRVLTILRKPSTSDSHPRQTQIYCGVTNTLSDVRK